MAKLLLACNIFQEHHGGVIRGSTKRDAEGFVVECPNRWFNQLINWDALNLYARVDWIQQLAQTTVRHLAALFVFWLLTGRTDVSVTQAEAQWAVRFDSSDFYGQQSEFTAMHQMWLTHINDNGAALGGLWWTLVSLLYDLWSAVNPQCVYVLYSVCERQC